MFARSLNITLLDYICGILLLPSPFLPSFVSISSLKTVWAALGRSQTCSTLNPPESKHRHNSENGAAPCRIFPHQVCWCPNLHVKCNHKLPTTPLCTDMPSIPLLVFACLPESLLRQKQLVGCMLNLVGHILPANHRANDRCSQQFEPTCLSKEKHERKFSRKLNKVSLRKVRGE